jgi:hypothetical protein
VEASMNMQGIPCKCRTEQISQQSSRSGSRTMQFLQRDGTA